MNDHEIITVIRALVWDEQALRLRHRPDTPLGDEDAAKLHRIEEQLDQCYDLLRQRRAQREFGGDKDAAKPRDAGTVERYLQ